MKLILFVTFLVTSSIAYTQNKTVQIDKKLLIGRWVSAEDKKDYMVITDSLVEAYYDKEKVETCLYKIENDKLIETDKEYGDVSNYYIESLTKEKLILMYDNGNMLIYNKSK